MRRGELSDVAFSESIAGANSRARTGASPRANSNADTGPERRHGHHDQFR